MLWPVAALAGLLLSFVLVYGSMVQSRMNTGGVRRADSLEHERLQ
jgi:hypothetical protein